MSLATARGHAALGAVIGLIAGGSAAILLRPVAPAGCGVAPGAQMPIAAILTAGRALSPAEMGLAPFIPGSLLLVVIGALAGAVLLAAGVSLAPQRPSRRIIGTLLMALIGTALGLHFRPAAGGPKHLDFVAVLTRGDSLIGAERLLVATAHVAFNRVIAGTILGAVLGFLVGSFMPVRQRARSDQAHLVVLSIALVAGLAELAYAVLNVSAMPVYLRYSMGYGADSIASIGIAFLLCEGLMKGPFGMLGDRVGRKRLIIAGPLVSVVTSLLTLLIHPHQWYFFVALRVLDGLGAAALWPAALAMIADVVSEERRSHAMSLFNVTYMIGIGVGPFIGGAANDLAAILTQRVPIVLAKHAPRALAPHIHGASIDPLRTSFYVVSVLFLLTGLVAYLRIPHVAPHHERHPAAEGAFTLREMFRGLRQMPYPLLMAFVTFLGVGQIMLIIKLFALDEFRISETVFGALLLVPCLIIGLASVPLGTIGDRIGRPRAVRIGIGMCAASMWALVFVRSEWALVIGGSLIGVGFVIAFPSWMAYVSTACDPRQRGAIMGSVGTAQGMGAVIGAPIGGYLYEHAHVHIAMLPWVNAHYVPFIVCASLLVVSWIIALLTIHNEPPAAAKAPT